LKQKFDVPNSKCITKQQNKLFYNGFYHFYIQSMKFILVCYLSVRFYLTSIIYVAFCVNLKTLQMLRHIANFRKGYLMCYNVRTNVKVRNKVF